MCFVTPVGSVTLPQLSLVVAPPTNDGCIILRRDTTENLGLLQDWLVEGLCTGGSSTCVWLHFGFTGHLKVGNLTSSAQV